MHGLRLMVDYWCVQLLDVQGSYYVIGQEVSAMIKVQYFSRIN